MLYFSLSRGFQNNRVSLHEKDQGMAAKQFLFSVKCGFARVHLL